MHTWESASGNVYKYKAHSHRIAILAFLAPFLRLPSSLRPTSQWLRARRKGPILNIHHLQCASVFHHHIAVFVAAFQLLAFSLDISFHLGLYSQMQITTNMGKFWLCFSPLCSPASSCKQSLTAWSINYKLEMSALLCKLLYLAWCQIPSKDVLSGILTISRLYLQIGATGQKTKTLRSLPA